METVTIPKSAAICAAMHYIELHEAVKAERRANFAAPCEACPIAKDCRFDWAETAAPLFDAVRLWPSLAEGVPPLLSGREDK